MEYEKSEVLTQREVEVLDYAKKGLSNEEIADMIFISRHTAKAHISSIIRKLHAKNRINALYIAIKKGLIK